MPHLGRECACFSEVGHRQHIGMIGHFDLLQIGRVEHFAPTVSEDRLRRRLKKLPAEHQHAMVEESLVDRREGALVKGMVKVNSFHLGPDRASESSDGNLRAHSFPPCSQSQRSADVAKGFQPGTATLSARYGSSKRACLQCFRRRKTVSRWGAEQRSDDLRLCRYSAPLACGFKGSAETTRNNSRFGIMQLFV